MRFWQALSHTEPDQVVDVARIAEQVGFHGVLASDHLFYPGKLESRYPYAEDGKPAFDPDTPWLDNFSLLGAIAGATTQLQLSNAVYVLPLRHPFEVAKALATLSIVSGGRVALGAGVGWMKEEFDQLGRDFRTRGRRTDEMIEVMRKLWRGGAVEHHGRFYDFDPLTMSPAPPGSVPIWIGGQSEAALRRAARLGDGWIASGAAADEVPGYLERLRRLREEAGRADAPFRVLIPLSEIPDADTAKTLGEQDVDVVLWPVAFQIGKMASPLDEKRRALERFGEDVISRS